MMRLTDRRAPVDENRGDRLTKQFIVWTVCAIALIIVMTMCRMALSGVGVPDPIDRLATLVIGAMIGWIGKTGVDKVMNDPVPVVNVPGEPIETKEVTE